MTDTQLKESLKKSAPLMNLEERKIEKKQEIVASNQKEYPAYSEQAISHSSLPDVVKDMFRNRTRMGTALDEDGNKVFCKNGNYYRYKDWTENEVTKYLLQVLGYLPTSTLDTSTMQDFLHHGFRPIPSFYGNSDKHLCLSTSWFSFVGAKYDAEGTATEEINVVICFGKGKDGVTNLTTYSSKQDMRKVGIFNDLNDVIDIFSLDNFIPSKQLNSGLFEPDMSLLEEFQVTPASADTISEEAMDALNEINERIRETGVNLKDDDIRGRIIAENNKPRQKSDGEISNLITTLR